MITVDLKDFEKEIDDYIQLMKKRVAMKIRLDNDGIVEFLPHNNPLKKKL
jgi:hypothetical protein